ncbi:alkaline shock response membrane anchor protein AmaP [Kitasatospora sp. NPDC094015]|uniref:alkaline shock response membrane anchor protein AmaP n=1 Tax=Kitasatospora sp. NPDC094015 TaxID=3155205 RepID=UPI003330467D
MSRGTVNRTILAVAGVLLLAGGLLVLAGGLDLYGRVGLSMPHRWPLLGADRPLFGGVARSRWEHRSWWWPVVIAVLAVLVVGALAWLVTQLRRRGPVSVELPSPAPATTLRVRGRAVEEAIETGAVALPGVERVAARLDHRPGRPVVRTAIRLTTDGGPAELLAGYRSGPLADARDSLGLAALDSELRLRVVAVRPTRARKRARVV